MMCRYVEHYLSYITVYYFSYVFLLTHTKNTYTICVKLLLIQLSDCPYTVSVCSQYTKLPVRIMRCKSHKLSDMYSTKNDCFI